MIQKEISTIRSMSVNDPRSRENKERKRQTVVVIKEEWPEEALLGKRNLSINMK